MKPRILDRLLLIIIMLALFALGVAFIAAALNIITIDMVTAVISLPYASAGSGWITAGIGLLLAVTAIALIVGFNRRPEKERGPATALISQSELGTSSITLAAVDEMVRRHCSKNSSVTKCDSVISTSSNKLVISLKLNLTEDANIPETTGALRSNLTDYLQTTTGIEVGNISMLVATEPEKLSAN